MVSLPSATSYVLPAAVREVVRFRMDDEASQQSSISQSKAQISSSTDSQALRFSDLRLEQPGVKSNIVYEMAQGLMEKLVVEAYHISMKGRRAVVLSSEEKGIVINMYACQHLQGGYLIN